MATGYWVIRTYKAGRIGEKVKFWVSGNPKHRNCRKEKQSLKKTEQNEASAIKRSARILNQNFAGRDSVLLGFDYSDDGIGRLIAKIRKAGTDWDGLDMNGKRDALFEMAKKEINNLIARVNYELKKSGEQLRYYGVTSDLEVEDDGTKRPCRIHHHLVAQAGYEGLFAEKWKELGTVHWSAISKRQVDLLPIAVYLCQQVRHVDNAKMYIRSRNLEEPKCSDRVVYTGAELRPPKRARVLNRCEYKGPYHPQYMRYDMGTEQADTGQEVHT